jgi:predicted nucleotidyltransferase
MESITNIKMRTHTLSDLNIDMHPITRKTLDLFVNRVKENDGDNLSKIILFGSVARGEANEDSDIDVLIVLKECSLKHRRDMVRISSSVMWDLDFDINAYIQLVTMSEEESQGLDFYGLMLNVNEEGVVLYDSQQ